MRIFDIDENSSESFSEYHRIRRNFIFHSHFLEDTHSVMIFNPHTVYFYLSNKDFPPLKKSYDMNNPLESIYSAIQKGDHHIIDEKISIFCTDV